MTKQTIYAAIGLILFILILGIVGHYDHETEMLEAQQTVQN